ncbi:unnamed protein product, partial [marine sediment metagenome]
YALIPVSVIYHDLAFGKAKSEGAEEEKDAETEAKLSKTRGSGKRSKGKKTKSGLPSRSEMEAMGDEEFNKTISPQG